MLCGFATGRFSWVCAGKSRTIVKSEQTFRLHSANHVLVCKHLLLSIVSDQHEIVYWIE